MYIAQVIQEYHSLISGPAAHVFLLTNQFEKVGHENIIFASDEGSSSSKNRIGEAVPSILIKRFPVHFKFMQYFFVTGIRKAFRENKVDVYHVHSWHNQLCDTIIKLAKKDGVPVIIQAHGTASAKEIVANGTNNPFSSLPYTVYDFLFRKNILQADIIIATTSQEVSECREYGFQSEQIRLIPLGVDSKRFARDDLKIANSNVITILCVARISRDRNIELILKALSELPEQIKNRMILRVVGPEAKRSTLSKGGYINDLQKLSADLGISEQVKFVGPKKGDGLISEYINADIFTYASTYENFGYTILEAAAAGLPLLVTPTGVANDLVQNGKTGYLVSMHDHLDLAQHLKEVIVNTTLRESLGNAVAKVVRERYTVTQVSQKYLELYEQLSIAKNKS